MTKSGKKIEKQLQQMRNVDSFFKPYDFHAEGRDYYYILSHT